MSLHLSIPPLLSSATSIQRIAFICASLGFVGCVRPWSGTWGTLVAFPFAVAALYLLPPLHYLFLTLALLPIGLLSTHLILTQPKEDPHYVVIDEALGIYLTLAFLLPFPPSVITPLLAFVLFRLFDGLKPFPVGLIDKKVHGAWGVMMDDVAAALMAGAILVPLAILHVNVSS